MIKRLCVLLGIALFSLDASAAYIRYDFGGPMSGYFVQLDDNGAIVDYRIGLPIAGARSPTVGGFTLSITPERSDGVTQVTNATTYFRNNGPTNFSIFSNFGGDQLTNFSVDFSRATQGNFAYTTQYASSIYFTGGYQSFAGTIAGLVSQGTITSAMATDLDLARSAGELVPFIPTLISPRQVPEPSSLALVAIGVFGAIASVCRTRRRRVEQRNDDV